MIPTFATEEKQFAIHQSTHTTNRYDVYISKQIGAVHEYEDLFNLFSTANEADVIYLHINCPGGSVDTGLQIISFMRDSRATIVTAIYGTTASMGTAIFLSGDEFIVSQYSRIMIHNFSGGVVGKGHELKAELKSTSDWVEKAFKEIHVPFLTEEEYGRVVDGADMWMLADEVKTRLESLIEHREEQYADQELEYKVQLIKEIMDGLTGDSESVESIKSQVDQEFGHLLVDPVDVVTETVHPKKTNRTKKFDIPTPETKSVKIGSNRIIKHLIR